MNISGYVSDYNSECASYPNTVAIIQARMGSSRLPGKTLLQIAGHAMLWHIVQRARRASQLDHVLVATSTARTDDPIEEYCSAQGFACFRGSESDVLDRYYNAAISVDAEVIVRLTADCPLHDPLVIDHVVSAFRQGQFDYVSNVAPPTYPDGLDTEVFTFAALKETWTHASLASEHEHVTPYIRGGRKFRSHNVTLPTDLSSLRWTVDELADLAFVRTIFHALDRVDFGLEDILALLNNAPHFCRIDAAITRNEGYQRSLQAERIAV